MGFDILTIGVSKKYTEKTIIGEGAIKGKDGIDGKSAYEIAKDNGYIGTEQEWLKSIDGIDGVGISKIDKISTVDLIDTYRITFTDNSTFDYEVKNGSNGSASSEDITMIKAVL